MKLHLLTGLVFCSLFVSCAPDTTNSGGGIYQAVYLPYVESVKLPATVVAGEPFTVVLKLSAESKPGLLNGVPSDASQAGYQGSFWVPGFKYVGPAMAEIYPWLWNPTYEGALAQGYEIPITVSQAGTFILRVQSADTRANGGLEDFYGSPGLISPDHADTIVQDYSIEVLPVTP